MLTRIRVHFGNKMGEAGKGGIHFYKNWVNKKANHLSPETWMKPAKPAPKTRFFSHPQVYSNRMYHYQNASRRGLKLKWLILSIVHCGCQSQNNIGFNCCVLITCDQVFFFFSGEGESRPDRQTCIEIWRWHNLKPARARWKSFLPDKLT